MLGGYNGSPGVYRPVGRRGDLLLRNSYPEFRWRFTLPSS